MRLRNMLPLVAAAMLAAPAAAQADFMHTVTPGESLTSIARTDGLRIAQLAAANGISPSTRLVAGSTLAIPAQGAPAAPTARASSGSSSGGDFMHTVTPGESLTSIARADGLTIAQLAAANGISRFTRLVAGSTLAIPAQGAPAATTARASTGSSSHPSSHCADRDNDGDDNGCSTASAAPTARAASTSSLGGSYVVRPGDTLSGIAARAGTTVSALAALNGLNPKHFLLYGTTLRLSRGSAVPAGSVASTEPVGAAAVGSLKAPPYPTPQRVSAGQIGSIAAANGVPPSFAEGIGWQESGFSNDVVSPVGARGVMQILPGTWNWIGQDLNRGGIPLAPASALDNVRGGVIMLHALLGATGGDEAQAAAGYYQGLSSVQKHGMYSDTKQYVRDVLALSQRFGGG